ncbi:LacI family DNA-binding transcriptional regulator [Enterococcus asini]|uniref:LacI family DNA-binding transcriptional regulator n=1 Tax=Enterococcus asini TaxID=57732 RepID=UPI002891F3D8|nr:LacI family DNA-binding transcriptional regulator [Enterococcus asini]MDT2756723.1 LacI family DNA-binding transcriptional regulator [Enterococcus asini]
MATIRDVAKLAGVSVATVSRAINESGYVSKEAREKIEAAIKELDFAPNEVARSLFQKKSKLVGLLLPDISNPFFPLLAKGVEDNMNEKGYQVILGNVQEDAEKGLDYLRVFNQNNVSGVLSAIASDSMGIFDKPLVVLDRVDDKTEYAVYSDDLLGGLIAAEAILKGNPKEIVVVAGPEQVTRSWDRLLSVENTLKKANQHYSILQADSFQFQSAEAVANELFEKFPQVDSVIAPSDTHAIAILQAANQRGLKIPEEFQIVGYDDIPISNLVFPRLSTVHQPAYQIGWQGAELLFKLMNNLPILENKIKLPVFLQNRDTLRIEKG